MISDMFGIHPWDMDRLTPEEFSSLAEYVDRLNRDARRAQ